MVNSVPILDWIFHSEVHSDDGAPAVPLTVVINPMQLSAPQLDFEQLRFSAVWKI